jgi:hypothetical protein
MITRESKAREARLQKHFSDMAKEYWKNIDAHHQEKMKKAEDTIEGWRQLNDSEELIMMKATNKSIYNKNMISELNNLLRTTNDAQNDLDKVKNQLLSLGNQLDSFGGYFYTIRECLAEVDTKIRDAKSKRWDLYNILYKLQRLLQRTIHEEEFDGFAKLANKERVESKKGYAVWARRSANGEPNALPMTSSASSALPMTSSASSALPMTSSASSVLPMTSSASSALLMTSSASSALPMTSSASSALPMTSSASSALPMTSSALPRITRSKSKSTVMTRAQSKKQKRSI